MSKSQFKVHQRYFFDGRVPRGETLNILYTTVKQRPRLNQGMLYTNLFHPAGIFQHQFEYLQYRIHKQVDHPIAPLMAFPDMPVEQHSAQIVQNRVRGD